MLRGLTTRGRDIRRALAVAVLAFASPATSAVEGRASTFHLGQPGCPGARPGAILAQDGFAGSDPRGYATFGFTFEGSDGRIYTSTAGHVMLGQASGEQAWPSGNGVSVLDLEGNRIGEYVYAINTRTGSHPGLPSGADLALIRVDEQASVGTSVCDLGEPGSIDTRIVPPPEPVELVWYGAAFVGARVGPPVPVDNTWVMPSREGMSLGMPSAERVAVIGFASFGDSGAPVLTRDGGAVGLISGPPQDSQEVPANGHAGVFIVPRLSPALSRASHLLGIGFTLAPPA